MIKFNDSDPTERVKQGYSHYSQTKNGPGFPFPLEDDVLVLVYLRGGAIARLPHPP
jgi:hypothetical protein